MYAYMHFHRHIPICHIFFLIFGPKQFSWEVLEILTVGMSRVPCLGVSKKSRKTWWPEHSLPGWFLGVAVSLVWAPRASAWKMVQILFALTF